MNEPGQSAIPSATAEAPLLVNVQTTVADFREANAAVRAQGLQIANMLPTFYVLLSYAVGGIIGPMFQERPRGAPPYSLVDTLISSVPLLLFSIYWGVIAYRLRGRRARGFVVPPPRLTGVGVAVPAAICAAVFAVTVTCSAKMPVDPTPPPPPARQTLSQVVTMLVCSFAPIVALIIGEIFLFLKLFGGSITRSYELQVNLHRPFTFQAGSDGVVITDEAQQTRSRWTAFIGWHETPNLYLVYRSYITFHMVPKRSFRSAEELDQFVELLRRHIGEHRRGFDPIFPAPVATR